MHSIGLRLLLVLCAGLCAIAATGAEASSVPACPVGQVPNWNNTSCMATQTNPSFSSYGIPSAGKAYLPGGIANSNPAIQDCNGIPIPIGQSCSAAKPSLATMPLSSIPATIAAQTPASPVSSAPAPTIVVSSPGSANATSPPSIGPSGVTAVAPPPSAAAVAAAAVAAGEFVDPTQTLANLLGDWYTGWLQYAAATLNLSSDTQKSISTTFLGFPACLQAQQQPCEDAIWASLSQLLGPSLDQTGGGS